MTTSKPNVLMIIADDLNSWIGALGRHPDVRTPAIDALAARGTLFTRAYCAAPYCNASRMSLFTGCLPSTTGVYGNEPFWDQPNRPATIFETFKNNGYVTYGAGKVFHGVYDYATAGRIGATDANWREIENRHHQWDGFAEFEKEPLPQNRPLNGLFDFGDFENVPPWYRHFDWGPLPPNAEERTPDEAVCRSVSAFLKSPPHTPFFCTAGLYKPHLPWHAPKRFFDLYDPATLTLPVVRLDDLDDVPPIGRQWALTPDDHALVVRTDSWRPAVQGYLACISYCDWMVGRIVDALDSSGAADDTWIVFCGDNGFHLGEKLHWRKFTLWEEATRVPLIVVPPKGITALASVSRPVSLVDLAPTLWRACSIDSPHLSDGFDLLGIMCGETRHNPAVSTWGRGNHSVRRENWRFTQYSDGTEELYDQDVDPNEWNNLAGDARFNSVRTAMRELMPDDLAPA